MPERLLERERELAVLEDVLDEAAAGRSAVVVIEGEAGIGKSSLLEWARQAAAERRLRWVSARAAEVERDYAHGIVRQLFGPALTRAGADESARLLAAGAAAAAALFDVSAGGAAAGDGRFRTLDGLYWLTSNLAESQPLVMVVDDAHWADDASMAFIEFLVRRLHDLPVALLIAARADPAGSQRQALDRLLAQSRALRVVLAPLSAQATDEIVRARLGVATAAFITACQALTGGNPFLLEELLGEVERQSIPPDDRGSRRLPGAMPAAVSRSVLQRMGTVPRPALALARATAVLAGRAPLALAATVAGLDRDAARTAADQLVATGMLKDAVPLSFTHPLIGSAVYAGTPPNERSRLHESAAHALRHEKAPAEQVAVHLLAVEPAGDPDTVATLREAAAAALARGAAEAAASYLRRAIEERPAAPGTARMRLDLVGAVVRAGQVPPDLGNLVEDVASGRIEARDLGESARDLGYALLALGRVDRAVELLEGSLGTLEPADRELALRLEAELYLLGTVAGRSRQAAARVTRFADLPGTTPGQAVALAAAAAALSTAGGGAAASVAIVERALDGGCMFASETANSLAWTRGVLAAWRGERWDLVDRLVAGATVRARETGSPLELAYAFSWGATLALLRGHADDAAVEAARAVEVADRAGFDFLRADVTESLLWALREQGAFEEAEALIAQTPADLPQAAPFGGRLAVRARIHLDRGQLRSAQEDLDRLLALHGREGRSGVHRLLRAGAVEILVATGRREEAGALADAALEAARGWGTPVRTAAALRAQAAVAPERPALLRDALELLEPGEARLELGWTAFGLGAALRRQGDRAAARPPLRRALELASAGGARLLEKAARRELAATGVRVPASDEGEGRLTAAERRVAELAAAGMSNREIAQRLYLTVKTVETHLSSVYRKLGVTGRSALAPALEP